MKRMAIAAFAVGMALLGILSVPANLRSEDPPKDPPKGKPVALLEIDKRIYDNLGKVINVGAHLNNEGDPAACYRLFEGALMMTVPMLEHRPELRVNIEKGMKAVEALASVEDKAFASRDLIDLIRKTLKKDLAIPPASESLWERMGGERVVLAIVHDLLHAAATDDKVNFDRDGKIKIDKALARRLEKRLMQWFSAQTGGPLRYEGKDMKTLHEGMGIKPEEFDALTGHLQRILETLQVPEAEAREFMKIVLLTRRDVIEAKKAVPPAERLWTRLGGETALRPILRDFLEAAAKDPKVNLSRNGKFQIDAAGLQHLEDMFLAYFSRISGGPIEYTGKDLRAAHAGMKISAEELEALGRHLDEALSRHKVPEALAREVMAGFADAGKQVVEPEAQPK